MAGFEEDSLPESNLGINDLLAELTEPVDDSNNKMATQSSLPDDVLSSSASSSASMKLSRESANQKLDGYLALYEKNQVVELASAVETELAAHPDNPEINLWWVLTQMEIKTIPNSILASTLDNVCENFEELTQGKFFEWIDLRVLEAPSQMGRGEASSRLKFLFRAVLVQMQKNLASGNEFELSQHFSAKLKQFGLEIDVPETAIEKSSPQSQAQQEGTQTPRKTASKAWLRVGFGLSIVLGGVFVWWLMPTTPAKFANIAYSDLNIGERHLEIPKSLRIESTSLDTLLYAIRKPDVDATAQASTNSPAEPQKPVVAINNQKPLEQIDTSGPIEGTVFNPPPVERYPSRSEIVEREKTLTNSGNIPSSFPGSAVSMERAPLGASRGRDRSERGGDIFRVTRRTEVMERPSYNSRVASVLSEGARVEVIGHIGIWLKLRSKNGDIGYMDDRDADPLR